jgi:hypothetical protein
MSILSQMIGFSKDLGPVKADTLTLDKIVYPLKEILKQRFPGDLERQRIVPRLNGTRLNFCCPYCGDSHTDAKKKRGNFYTNWLYFKCYNGGCGQYVDIIEMIKNFKVSANMTPEEITSAKLRIAASREASKQEMILRHELSLNALTNTDFEKVLVPRKDLMNTLGLMEIHPKSPTGIYLLKRCQTPDKRFAWDPKRKRLFIFNLDPTSEWIFSLQTRQFESNAGNKYLTYNLSGIWLKMMGNKDEEFLTSIRPLDQISTVFNVLNINFNDMITLFEGPLDSFLFGNSCAMCSVNNDWPFDVDNIRWFQDNDDAGRKKALDVINTDKSVFLWKNFIDDFELHGKKIKDYNDIVVYQKANNIDFGDLEKYWSTHKYDGIFL